VPYGVGGRAWASGSGWPTWAWPFDPFGYPADYGYLPGTGWSSGVWIGGYDGDRWEGWEPDRGSPNPLDRVPTVLDPAIAEAAPLDACQLYDADAGYLVGDPVPCDEVGGALSPGLWVVSRTAAAPGEVHGRFLDDAGRPLDLVFDVDTGRLLEQLPG
jgi:hypothetical protein